MEGRSFSEKVAYVYRKQLEEADFIVINKCDGDRRGPRLPEERIKKELGVVEFIPTSCDKGEEAAATIQALRELITQTLATHDGLKHIHDPFPRPYLRVKEAVAALAKKETLLDRAKFEQVCAQGGEDEAVSDPAEQRLLLGTLQDLGGRFPFRLLGQTVKGFKNRFNRLRHIHDDPAHYTGMLTLGRARRGHPLDEPVGRLKPGRKDAESALEGACLGAYQA